MSSYHYLIIGNGAAGVSAAEIIRQRDGNGRITIVTDEPYLFYSRPGIAYYLTNQVSDSQLITRRESFYRDHRFEVRFGRVSRLDLPARLAFFSDGQPLAYDVLLLATGAAAVPSAVPGSDLDGVVTFDTMDNAKDIVHRARRTKDAVVVGGGITAMELAEGLQRQGVRTHLLQRQDRIWPRLLDDRESSIIEDRIAHEGIRLYYRQEIAEILGKNGRVRGVRLESGQEIKCQMVGIAIGVRPNLTLIREQPIDLDRGILVNEFMQSSQPRLFAAGDVAQVYDRWTKEHNLDILWPSAINEGRAAGYNMVDIAHGRSPSYAYVKGSPFNAAMLFGVHLTVIGRVGSRSEEGIEELSHLSRGSSHVWTAPFSTSHRSAWDKDGPNSVRIVMAGGRIVGALLLGNQELADPLRKLVEHEADLSHMQSELLGTTDNLPRTILQAWRTWNQSWQ